jgi:hypothetical protein
VDLLGQVDLLWHSVPDKQLTLLGQLDLLWHSAADMHVDLLGQVDLLWQFIPPTFRTCKSENL